MSKTPSTSAASLKMVAAHKSELEHLLDKQKRGLTVDDTSSVVACKATETVLYHVVNGRIEVPIEEIIGYTRAAIAALELGSDPVLWNY